MIIKCGLLMYLLNSGPFAWGPLSEQFGRRPIFLITFFIYFIFQIACALSKTTAQLLVFRFLGGLFAAAPLTNSGALIADIWDANSRGKALAIFTVSSSIHFFHPLC
jgi:MFS family permease